MADGRPGPAYTKTTCFFLLLHAASVHPGERELQRETEREMRCEQRGPSSCGTHQDDPTLHLTPTLYSGSGFRALPAPGRMPIGKPEAQLPPSGTARDLENVSSSMRMALAALLRSLQDQSTQDRAALLLSQLGVKSHPPVSPTI